MTCTPQVSNPAFEAHVRIECVRCGSLVCVFRGYEVVESLTPLMRCVACANSLVIPLDIARQHEMKHAVEDHTTRALSCVFCCR